jgi:hypothetical protein
MSAAESKRDLSPSNPLLPDEVEGHNETGLCASKSSQARRPT